MIIAISGLSLPDFLRNILFAIRLSQIDKILLVFRVDIFFRDSRRYRDRFRKENFLGIDIEERNRSRDRKVQSCRTLAYRHFLQSYVYFTTVLACSELYTNTSNDSISSCNLDHR